MYAGKFLIKKKIKTLSVFVFVPIFLPKVETKKKKF